MSAAKSRSVFYCQSCGGESPKWTGQCPDCAAWNTLVETPPAGKSAKRHGYAGDGPSRIVDAGSVDAAAEPHISTGIAELDRVLGGGLVAGAVVLLGGDPGIGKSTLLLQALTGLADNGASPALYVTGEESLGQVVGRAERLELPTGDLRLLTETRVEQILSLAAAERPRVLIIDSIQTIYTEELNSAPGGVAQIRESAAQLVRFAKATGTALFLVGHVTKEGALAGPRVLEHMVDTVLYFESENDSRFRIIRTVKNRFGAANELGLFAMTGTGLKEVANPSAIFLSRHEIKTPGSVVTVTREGTRPLLIELQSLVDNSAMGNPRRVSVGLDPNRLSMLLAVLNRRGGVPVHDQDVYVNVVGGVRLQETAADLAAMLSVVSSARDRAFPQDTVVFGEVGLAGEIRPVPYGEERLKEAAKHGFKRAIVPKANAPRRDLDGITSYPVSHLGDALAFD